MPSLHVLRQRIPKTLATVAGTLSLCACGPQNSPTSPTAPSPSRDFKTLFPASLNQRVVRMTWVEQSPDKPDAWRVMVLDSQDGKGIRAITDYGACYRPIVSADGLSVFFTLTESGQDSIVRLNWDGSGREIIGRGFCTASRRSSRGEICVLAVVAEGGADGNTETRAVSYQVGRSGSAELIWAQPERGVRSFSMSRDGRRGAILDGGLALLLNLQDTTSKEVGKGSWVGIAPDDSYVTAAFDSLNTKLIFSQPQTASPWEVPLTTRAELANAYVQNVQWGNDGRCFTFTGPHPRSTSSQPSPDAAGEVCFLMLDDELKSITHFSQITQNKLAEADPHVWIEGADKTTLTLFTQQPAGVPAEKLLPWPHNRDGLVFAWENARSEIELGEEEKSICRVEARKYGCFSRWFGMNVTGGAFEVDAISSNRLARECTKNNALSLSFLITESRTGRELMSRKLVSYECPDGSLPFALFRINNALVLRVLLGDRGAPPTDIPVKITDLRISDDRPAHLTISLTDKGLNVWLDGALVGQHTLPNFKLDNWQPGTLVFGDVEPYGGSWEGDIELVSVYARGLNGEEAMALSQAALQRSSQREKPDALRLRAKLLAATPIPPEDTWGPYRRILVANTYEVVSINAGKIQDRNVTALHWAVMDRKPVATLPSKIGEIYDLYLEPMTAHPELKAERKDLGEAPPDSPIYYQAELPPG